MENKLKYLVSAFCPSDTPFPKEKDFDKDYKSIKIVDVVKKTGDGENDFIIEKKVIEEFTPIKDVVEADRDTVGVDNIIKQVLRTGDTSLLPVDKGECNVDLVGAPETLMDLKQLGVEAEKGFNSLPSELTNGLDMVSFINSMSQEKFDAFVAAIKNRAAGNTESEVKSNE